MPKPMLALKMAIAFGRIVRDPNQLDVVFDLVDSISEDPSSQAELEAALQDPDIALAARARRRIPDLDLATLERMPEGSVGRVAARFFRDNDLDPAALPRREATTDYEWLSAHLYETHDLWHVVTGFGPDIAGELGLQGFYAAQIEGSVALAILSAGMLNTLLFAPAERKERLAAISRGFSMGQRAKSLVGADWARLLPLPLAEVRAELGLEGDAPLSVAA
jgi:ubiquinone biosynthesis protein Coq4